MSMAILLSFSSKSSSDELRINLAPSFLSNYACSSLLTTLMTCIFSGAKNLLTILPTWEAAAVWIIVFAPIFLAISKNPMTVNGLTKLIEACSKVVYSSTGIHSSDLANAYWAYVPEDSIGVKATFLFVTLHPKNPPPFYMTNPLPSKPIVHGHFLVSEYLPSLIKTTSDGLIGAAITFINTCPDSGFGIGIYLTTNLFAAYKIIAFIIVFFTYIIFINYLGNQLSTIPIFTNLFY